MPGFSLAAKGTLGVEARWRQGVQSPKGDNIGDGEGVEAKLAIFRPPTAGDNIGDGEGIDARWRQDAQSLCPMPKVQLAGELISLLYELHKDKINDGKTDFDLDDLL